MKFETAYSLMAAYLSTQPTDTPMAEALRMLVQHSTPYYPNTKLCPSDTRKKLYGIAPGSPYYCRMDDLLEDHNREDEIRACQQCFQFLHIREMDKRKAQDDTD